MGVYLMGMYLIGVYLMGLYLIDVYLWTCICFQIQKCLGETLQIPHLTNGPYYAPHLARRSS